jgi:hypothetical protein
MEWFIQYSTSCIFLSLCRGVLVDMVQSQVNPVGQSCVCQGLFVRKSQATGCGPQAVLLQLLHSWNGASC